MRLRGSGVAVLVAVAALAGCQADPTPEPDRFDVVATVNGEPIVYGELLANTTLEQSVVAKLQQLEARREGLVADISYRASLAELERTNRSRQEKVKRGGVVYGPITYDEKRFLDERLRSLRKGLRARLRVSGEEVARYYTANRERFSLGESRNVAGISAASADGMARLTVLERRLAGGESFDAIYAELRHVGDGVLSVEERTFDYRTVRADSLRSPALLRTVNELETGEVTGIVADARSAGIYKCLSKRSLGYAPIDEVRQGIVADLRARKYDAQVRQWRSSAEIGITPAGRALGLSVDGAAG